MSVTKLPILLFVMLLTACAERVAKDTTARQPEIFPDGIDPWIMYKLIPPGYEGWNEMGIYQRDLSGFEERTITDNSDNERGFPRLSARPSVFTSPTGRLFATSLTAHTPTSSIIRKSLSRKRATPPAISIVF